MKEYLKAMQKFSRHKGEKVFVVFDDRGFRGSCYGKVVQVMSRIIILETFPGGGMETSVAYESIVFVLDRRGDKIFAPKDLGPGTEMK